MTRYISGLKNNLGNYIYIIKCGKYYKIGITKRLASRITRFRVENPYDVKLVYTRNTKYNKYLEKELHSLLKKYLHRGEWFLISKGQIKSIINMIKNYGE